MVIAMKSIRYKAYALVLAGALLLTGLCGCRIESISNQIKDLYSVYMDSTESPVTAPDYENFRRVFPLAVWETWKETVFSGSESDMKRHFSETITEVKYSYSDTCGLDNTYKIEDVERSKIEGDELKKIKEVMQADFGIEPGEVGQVVTAVVTIVISGSLDTLTITHKQRLMKMNGKWYFCPVQSEDPFRLFRQQR